MVGMPLLRKHYSSLLIYRSRQDDTGRVSGKANAIGRVCPSVRPSVRPFVFNFIF